MSQNKKVRWVTQGGPHAPKEAKWIPPVGATFTHTLKMSLLSGQSKAIKPVASLPSPKLVGLFSKG